MHLWSGIIVLILSFRHALALSPILLNPYAFLPPSASHSQAEGCAQVHALRARCDAALITLAAAAAGGEQLPAAMVL